MRINVTLWLRTIFVAVGVTISCLLLAFPIAHLLATLPGKYSNLLMICVLLPFWTSLLVRTSSWMVLLQTQGVLNDILVFFNIVDDQERLVMMYNMMGTFIAMTQILLPFMVLPGSLLVFVLAIGYYITPALVGGAKGTLISNRIAYHMQNTLDWSLATAMGGVLLVTVLAVYYVYNRIVGIDNMRLG